MTAFPTRVRLAYHVLTWWCRGYLTFALAVLAALGAASGRAAAAMIGAGVALDLVRNRVAPDLTPSTAKLRARLAGADPEPGAVAA